MIRIDSIGLLCVPKERQQEHQPHPQYSYPEFLRIDSIGLFCVPKEQHQEHQPHPIYSYPEILRIDAIGIFGTYALSGKPQRSHLIKVLKNVGLQQ